VKRSSEFLSQRKAQSRAALERHVGDAADRLTEEGQEAISRHPLVSLGVASLAGWLAASALSSGKGRGAAAVGLTRALQSVALLRKFL
jgi:hypothetical protein